MALGLALPCTVSDSFFISLTAEDYAPLVDQKVLQLAALDSVPRHRPGQGFRWLALALVEETGHFVLGIWQVLEG